MKVAYCSDLHLEFGDLRLENTEGADVLVLAGDIVVAREVSFHKTRYKMTQDKNYNGRFYDFFKRVSEQFKHVVYVVGNHEHYSFDFKETVEHLKENLKVFPNIYLLDKDCKLIDDVMFIGGTLWTDVNGSDSEAMNYISRRMNDFINIANSNHMVARTVPLYQKDEEGKFVLDERGYYIQIDKKIKYEPATFSPEHSIEEHQKCLDFFDIVTENVEDKVVVVSHHTPSQKSCHPMYAHDTMMNAAYHNNLDEFIESRPNIKVWIHGHTHNSFDYDIGGCKVLCNPRGYHKYEQRAKEFTLKYMEI